MNLRKRTTVAHRTRQRSDYRVGSFLLGAALGACAGWVAGVEVATPKPIPEGVLVIRHGAEIQRYVAAEPTILCPDGTVRPMSNYRHVCEPGWRQP